MFDKNVTHILQLFQENLRVPCFVFNVIHLLLFFAQGVFFFLLSFVQFSNKIIN